MLQLTCTTGLSSRVTDFLLRTYVSLMGEVIGSHGVDHHQYADDTHHFLAMRVLKLSVPICLHLKYVLKLSNTGSPTMTSCWMPRSLKRCSSDPHRNWRQLQVPLPYQSLASVYPCHRWSSCSAWSSKADWHSTPMSKPSAKHSSTMHGRIVIYLIMTHYLPLPVAQKLTPTSSIAKLRNTLARILLQKTVIQTFNWTFARKMKELIALSKHKVYYSSTPDNLNNPLSDRVTNSSVALD